MPYSKRMIQLKGMQGCSWACVLFEGEVGAFMRLILLILLSAAFLGGYYLGQQPNSPDIFGAAAKVYAKASSEVNHVSHKALAPAEGAYVNPSAESDLEQSPVLARR